MADFINTVDALGDDAVIDSIIDRSITEFKDDSAESIGAYAFYDCSALKTVVVPNAISFGTRALGYCTHIETVDTANLTSIASYVFYVTTRLKTLILRNTSQICTLGANQTNLNTVPCYIYVPAALVDSYKAATNWSTYADQFRALEDYTVDGTTTGELDESKI